MASPATRSARSARSWRSPRSGSGRSRTAPCASSATPPQAPRWMADRPSGRPPARIVGLGRSGPREYAGGKDRPGEPEYRLPGATSEPRATAKPIHHGRPEHQGPRNVPGPFYVDATCIDCDLCRETPPGTSGATTATAAASSPTSPGPRGRGRLPGRPRGMPGRGHRPRRMIRPKDRMSNHGKHEITRKKTGPRDGFAPDLHPRGRSPAGRVRPDQLPLSRVNSCYFVVTLPGPRRSRSRISRSKPAAGPRGANTGPGR